MHRKQFRSSESGDSSDPQKATQVEICKYVALLQGQHKTMRDMHVQLKGKDESKLDTLIESFAAQHERCAVKLNFLICCMRVRKFARRLLMLVSRSVELDST